MFNNPKIWMERTHSRKGKCKVEFKGVVNKVLVTALILGAVTTSAPQAHAANFSIDFNSNANDTQIVQEYGISVEASINNIRNTIAEINSMKNRGTVSSSKIQELASELYDLEKAVHMSGGKVTQDVKNVVTQAEKSIAGVKNATKAEAALKFVKSSFGMDSVTVTQKKANALKSFSDVPTNHWAYDSIMNMAKKGVIAGTTTPDANGVGTFAPNSPMTRAQFVTVVTRYLYPDELAKMEKPDGTPWYFNNEMIAIDKGILNKGEFEGQTEMNKAMTRQEMAMVLSRALSELDQTPEVLIPNSSIPDYAKIGSYYRSYVKVVYTAGLICGTDSAGTFNPMGTLNRAQAATVLNRLLEPDTRIEVDVAKEIVTNQDYGIKDNQKVEVVGAQSWVEGEKHGMPKAGDTIIDKNGVKHTIQYDPVSGVLGGGLDIRYDIWSGFLEEGRMVNHYSNNITGRDSTQLCKDSITGQMHTSMEWSFMSTRLRPKTKGTYEGQIVNNWYKWEDNGWTWIGPR